MTVIHDADPRDPFGRPATIADGPLTISTEGAKDLVATRSGRDLLGVTLRSPRPAVAIASRMLRGSMVDDARDRVEAVIDAYDARLPPGFDETLLHHGIDPKAALALSLVANRDFLAIYRVDAVDGVRRIASLGLRQQDHTWVHLAPGISWRDTELLMPRLPETVVGAISGLPLRQVLSHPALDPLDLRIVDVCEQWEDPGMMEITTSLHQAA